LDKDFNIKERFVLMKYKMIVLVLVLIMFCVSCKKTDVNIDVENRTDEQEISDYTSDLHIEDYDGYEFRILIRPGQTKDQYVEEGSSDPIEDAVYKRNKLVEEMFNIEIIATESSNSNAETDALNPILAGDDAYDAIFSHTGAAFQYTTKGAVLNAHEIDSIHLDKPWWSRDIVENCTLNGNLYVLDGDISLHRLQNAMCMFFNKNIFDELGLEYPYELVELGEWTFDEFEELVKQGAKDLDGDGVMTPENDRFGFLSGQWNAPINCIYTGGQRIYSKNEEGILELSLNTSKTVDIYDSYFDLLSTDACFLRNNLAKYSGPDIFTSGRAMFADGSMGQAKSKRSMEDDFGILPYPKYDFEDEYASVVNGFAHLLVIPVTVEDESRTGAIIEALCAIGSRDVVPVFYDQSLKTKFTRDNESEAMLDIIKEGIVYDVGYATGGPLGYIGNELANKESPDFSSYYASNESAELARLNNFNEGYAGI
jgi:hypothetical protein